MDNDHASHEKAQCSCFVVDEKPWCVWDWDIRQLNERFLERFDPSFFDYVATAHLGSLDGEDKQHAAVALRTSYSHAMETLFAVIGAMLQAPDCVVGWLHKYRNEDLNSLVSKIHSHQAILAKIHLKEVSWFGLSNAVFSRISIADSGKHQRIRTEFGTFWSRLAAEFLDEQGSAEYNGFKHGLRLRGGGFQLFVGPEETPGQPCPDEKMAPLGGSTFGSTYYVPTTFNGVPPNIHVVQHSRNWTPENYAYRLRLISLSLQNILSFLRIMLGADPTQQRFVWPDNWEIFTECWRQNVGVTSMSMNQTITEKNIEAKTKNQIVAVYQSADQS